MSHRPTSRDPSGLETDTLPAIGIGREDRRVLCLIATYNEALNLPPLVERVLSLNRQLQVLIVDDESPDGTGEIADRFSRQDARVHVLHRPARSGLAGALLAGLGWAVERRFSLVANMDGDLSHSPSELPGLIEAATDADLVIGSRYVAGGQTPGWAVWRRLVSRVGGCYVRAVTQAPWSDPTSGFRVFNERALEVIQRAPLLSKGYSVHFEMAHRAWRAGLRVIEVPITYRLRRNGRSKLNARILLEALWVAAQLKPCVDLPTNSQPTSSR